MKALSIRQPWALLIIEGGKDIENRDWSTKFRGRVLIHAAKGMTKAGYVDAIAFAQHARPAMTPKPEPVIIPGPVTIQRGGIIGSVEIVDCVDRSESPWFMGKYGFVLRDPKPMPFIPWCGALGFFEVPDEALVTP